MTQSSERELESAVDGLVRAPLLVVASDFHGTLAEIRDGSDEPAVHPLAAEAIKTLLGLPQTEVCVISGVTVAELERCLGSYPRLQLIAAEKPAALQRLQDELNPSAILYLGDDASDEEAFAILAGPRPSVRGVTVKVGGGETVAQFRVSNSEEVARLLTMVAERRAAWFGGDPRNTIGELAFLSDLRTAAVLDRDSSVVWMCAPRIDSLPMFGSLVGGPGAGFFRVSADGEPERRYSKDSLVLETRWRDSMMTDFLGCEAGRGFQRAGRTDLRRVIHGSGEVRVEFAPRLDFGRIPTRLTAVEGGVRLEGGEFPSVLASPGWEWEIVREGVHDTARARRVLENETVVLELLLGTTNAKSIRLPAEQSLEQTQLFWRLWVQSLRIPEPLRELLSMSALVIRALSYGPTGAIAAAATTSLPETVGGVRNWDYRFCWPRDASLAATALAKLGAHEPGLRLLDWLLGILERETGERFLSPIYTVSGGHLAAEAEIAEAAGYRASRPVRVGNLAAHQLQLDVLGPIAELIGTLAVGGAALSPEHLSLTDRFVQLVGDRWSEPDSGIWEVRGEQRHYVHSKLMCWMVVNESQRVADAFGVSRPSWRPLADRIRADIEANGFFESTGSYGISYDSPEPDAAVLWVVLSGFHPPTHPRSIGTVRYLESMLLRDDMMYRYAFDDGLPGAEGSFHICLAWLIEALASQGETDRAETLLEKFLSRRSALGLLSEQWDPEHGALGNFPQAYSHLGVINAVMSLRGK